MNTEFDIEQTLRQAPRPLPPGDLRARLEEEVPFFPAEQPQHSHWKERLRRLWLPAFGLAGAAAALLLAMTVWLFFNTVTLAESVDALMRLRSFRVVERVRSGPARPVFKDRNVPEAVWPNHMTEVHPANPFQETTHWFQSAPAAPFQGRIHSLNQQTERWREGNRLLEIDRRTGERRFSLNSARSMFASLAAPLAQGKHIPLTEAKGNVPGMTAELGSRISVFESPRNVGGTGTFQRFWIDRASKRVVRIQRWGTEWPEIAPEVLLQEWEFTDFDQEFPPESFSFHPTDEDLASLGITRDSLAQLPQTAFSVRLTGEAGAEVEGTITDDSGKRNIRGKLPLSFVHSPSGEVFWKFQFVDGRSREIGIRVNESVMSAGARGLKGKITATEVSAQSLPPGRD